MSYENLNEFVDYIRVIQVKDDNNVNIGMTGRLGCGKSTLSMQIARRYVKRYLGKEFRINDYIAYTNEEVMEKIYSLPKYSPLIGDEGVRFAWSRDWNKSENKELARLSTQVRTKKLIFFINIPKISWIDSAFRESLIDIWIWVHSSFNEQGQKEGNALIFEPDQNQAETDSWRLDILKSKLRKRERIGRFTPIERLLKICKNNPCFVDSFKFPKLPEEMYQTYQRIRDRKAFEKEGEQMSQKDTTKILVYNLRKSYQKLIEEVEKGRFTYPSFLLIQKILLKHPITKNTIVKDTSIRNWYNEINDMVELHYAKPEEPETIIPEPDIKPPIS